MPQSAWLIGAATIRLPAAPGPCQHEPDWPHRGPADGVSSPDADLSRVPSGTLPDHILAARYARARPQTAKDARLMAHPYLKAHSLGHHYGGDVLFSGVDLVLNPGDRIGLVGPNGVGKTTLLRILAGELTPAAGHVIRRGSTGWSGAGSPGPGAGERTAGGYLAAGLGDLTRLAARMRSLEDALARGDES